MLKKHWPTESEINTGLEQAAEWIERHRVDGRHAWPISAGGHQASLWGGTVEAVRAVAALRDCGPRVASALDDVDLHAAAQWIKSRQNRDGSFNSDEFGFAGAEPTAWALIALHETAAKRDSRAVTAALHYLESCVDRHKGSVSSTPDDDELPRTLPSALTLWAFALWRHRKDLRDKIITYLMQCQDNESHGWGVTGVASPNAATTAQVLVAFHAAGVAFDQFRPAVRYLIGKQHDEGWWPNSIDEWHTPHDRASVQLTHKCVNSGTAWCLLALAPLEDRDSRSACLRAVRHLLGKQSHAAGTGGSWALWDDNARRHVWLTCQIVVALVAWHDGLPKQGIHRKGLRNALHRGLDALLNRAPLISALGVLGTVTALSIDTADPAFRERLIGDGTSFRQNLLTSGLTTAAVGAVSWFCRGLRDWRSRRGRQ
ncbi:prenyltransferase/squalene oxidase repeat-containing protein [Glycomyces tenuis]|uniref:prenyltransferase/squalene oxidase repeat-containing protein n=1 Tax=Glycomyces tenuis TaxID=58116 RepID=UPI00047E0F4E|nr:prenyltransferase/squalene oxidase repeat-containing protein [Glycomyces tenuis]